MELSPELHRMCEARVRWWRPVKRGSGELRSRSWLCRKLVFELV